MSLREELIEAGAKADYEVNALSLTGWKPEWDEEVEPVKQQTRQDVAVILDAFLDVLTERAAELADWGAEACAARNERCECVTDADVRGMLAVLREDAEVSLLVYRRPCPHGNEVCGVEYQHPYHGWMLCPGGIDLVLDPDKVLVRWGPGDMELFTVAHVLDVLDREAT